MLSIHTRKLETTKAALLTDGLSKEEKGEEEETKGKGWSLKSERERAFPVELVQSCLDIDIREASATEDIDKTRILNTLAGCPDELDAEPDLASLAHEAINQALRSLFAVAMWRKAVWDTLFSQAP